MKCLKFAVGFILSVVVVTLLVTATLNAREAARRTQWRNNLKQIGLAMHNYHDTFNTFPPGGIFREDGVAMHGWMTSIAPYIDASPFYFMLDLNRPWDHPVQVERYFAKHGYGRPFISEHAASSTRGPMQLTHMSANSWILHRNSSVGLKEIDDASHTMLLADSNEPYDVFGSTYNWRDPELERNSGPQAFGNIFSDGTYVLLADGSVTLVPLVDHERWKLLRGREELRPKPQDVERPTEAWELGDRPHDPVRIWQPGDGK